MMSEVQICQHNWHRLLPGVFPLHESRADMICGICTKNIVSFSVQPFLSNGVLRCKNCQHVCCQKCEATVLGANHVGSDNCIGLPPVYSTVPLQSSTSAACNDKHEEDEGEVKNRKNAVIKSSFLPFDVLGVISEFFCRTAKGAYLLLQVNKKWYSTILDECEGMWERLVVLRWSKSLKFPKTTVPVPPHKPHRFWLTLHRARSILTQSARRFGSQKLELHAIEDCPLWLAAAETEKEGEGNGADKKMKFAKNGQGEEVIGPQYKFQYRCPLLLEDLERCWDNSDTSTRGIKYYCRVCEKNVFAVANVEQLEAHIQQGDCVAFDPTITDQDARFNWRELTVMLVDDDGFSAQWLLECFSAAAQCISGQEDKKKTTVEREKNLPSWTHSSMLGKKCEASHSHLVLQGRIPPNDPIPHFVEFFIYRPTEKKGNRKDNDGKDEDQEDEGEAGEDPISTRGPQQRTASLVILLGQETKLPKMYRLFREHSILRVDVAELLMAKKSPKDLEKLGEKILLSIQQFYPERKNSRMMMMGKIAPIRPQWKFDFKKDGEAENKGGSCVSS